ncbi:uncharacterized protein LOC135690071 [Rhopilema esculentum]|uniref:uncharacterized protein LOC135690071 n=1 Tax=Rhopilema esculentum TaxID=499914 RepID=UPI0031DFA543
MTKGNKCEEKGQCEKPTVNAKGNEATTQIKKSRQNSEQNGGRSQKIFHSSIISVVIGLSNILIGTAILLKGMTSHHWVAKSAFGIWFGFFILCTGVIGISYSMSKSKKKEHLLVCLNVIAISLAIVSLGCYASAMVHYHGVRTGNISTMCSNTSGKRLNGDTESCRKRDINTATLFAVLNGFLLALSGIQCVVCILVMALCSSARDCCVRTFAGNDDSDEFWQSMYTGYPYVLKYSSFTNLHVLFDLNDHVSTVSVKSLETGHKEPRHPGKLKEENY